MDKTRLIVAFAVLDAVRVKFLETKKEDECQKEKISVEEVIFYKSKSKKLAQKNISCLQQVC